jgi:hypothetical protein
MGDMCRRFSLTCRFYHKGRENVVIYIHTYTRWFKCDRDKLWLVYTQIVPVIFKPPCVCVCIYIYICAPDYTAPHKWRQLSSLRCLTRKEKQNFWTRYNKDHTKWTTLKKSNWKVCLKKIFALFTEGIMQIRWDIKMGVADPQTQRPTGNKETVVPKGTVLMPILKFQGSNSYGAIAPRAFRKNNKRRQGSCPDGPTRLIISSRQLIPITYIFSNILWGSEDDIYITSKLINFANDGKIPWD